jgi:hypothetical protein
VLDRILMFVVIMGPTFFALVVEIMSESVRRHPFWRYGVIAFGVILSGLTWWQISRQEAKASIAQESAIERVSGEVSQKVSTSVAKSVGDQYQQTVQSLTDQIGALKGQLAAQGKKVDAISTSNIVTGKNPIKVQVTNPNEGSGPSLPNLSWSQDKAELVDGKPSIAVHFRIDGPLNLPAFAAFCDRPCKRVSGQAGVMSHYIDLDWPGQEKVTGAYFDVPKPFASGTSGMLQIVSLDGTPARINIFRIMKENEIPIELR